jgi:hypothetical protein
VLRYLPEAAIPGFSRDGAPPPGKKTTDAKASCGRVIGGPGPSRSPLGGALMRGFAMHWLVKANARTRAA